MEKVTVISAFIGGVLAFISPCILPILPGYLSFITGISLEELEAHKKSKEVLLQTFKQSALFVLGFTIVFTALGTTAAATRSLPAWLISVFERAAGAVVIIFGLQLMGVINIPFLNYEKRIEAGKKGVLSVPFCSAWLSPLAGLLALGLSSPPSIPWRPSTNPRYSRASSTCLSSPWESASLSSLPPCSSHGLYPSLRGSRGI